MVVIKSSQTTKFYITKVIYKHFSCHHHIKKTLFESLSKIKTIKYLTVQVTNEECHLKWRKLEYQTRSVRFCFNRVIEMNHKMLILKKSSLLHSVEVSHPKTINIKQYLSTDNFSVNNWQVVTKSSQTTQLYITKANYKHFSCHHHIKKHFL
jgi:hypothetical protein